MSENYARRFAAWARRERESHPANRFKCCVCGETQGELIEYCGRFYCPSHTCGYPTVRMLPDRTDG